MARQPKNVKRRHDAEPLNLPWKITEAFLYAPASVLTRLHTSNIERIPVKGPAIVVVNHVSHVDPFLVALMMLHAGRVPHFLAKDSIFEVPLVGRVMRGMGHIPVKRDTTDARQSFDAAVEALGRGELIVMHPEGTVTRDPARWPMVGKTGAARLAMLAPDVPVIPVVQWGVQDGYDLYHKKIKPFPRPVQSMSAGEPIDLSAFHGGDKPSATQLRAATDAIMKRLRHDLADLRGVPEPTGELFVFRRGADRSTSES